MNPSEELPGVGGLPPLRDQVLWKAIGTERLNPTVNTPKSTADPDRINMIVRTSGDQSLVEGTIGVIPFKVSLGGERASSSITHLATHPSSHRYAVASKAASSDGETCALHLLSFQSIEENGHYLGLIGRSCHRLQSWTAYILHCMDVLRILWKSGRRAFEQQVMNIEDTLAEKGIEGCNLTQQLYQLAFTGSCVSEVKTWIAEDMGSQVDMNRISVPGSC